ncbi:hypothetical protein [Embleya sp. NPDC005575]|uniref:hypothetical protein n=1 Tax=Embleya sp. NPDC005575 TaxID=3156892 RepID=UPI0033BE7EFA
MLVNDTAVDAVALALASVTAPMAALCLVVSRRLREHRFAQAGLVAANVVSPHRPLIDRTRRDRMAILHPITVRTRTGLVDLPMWETLRSADVWAWLRPATFERPKMAVARISGFADELVLAQRLTRHGLLPELGGDGAYVASVLRGDPLTARTIYSLAGSFVRLGEAIRALPPHGAPS